MCFFDSISIIIYVLLIMISISTKIQIIALYYIFVNIFGIIYQKFVW